MNFYIYYSSAAREYYRTTVEVVYMNKRRQKIKSRVGPPKTYVINKNDNMFELKRAFNDTYVLFISQKGGFDQKEYYYYYLKVDKSLVENLQRQLKHVNNNTITISSTHRIKETIKSY